ncbi:MAG: hypothetical protein ACFFA7_07595 [Promethearchaeota archaeon]
MKYESLSYLWDNLDTKALVEHYIRKFLVFTHTVFKLQKAD